MSNFVIIKRKATSELTLTDKETGQLVIRTFTTRWFTGYHIWRTNYITPKDTPRPSKVPQSIRDGKVNLFTLSYYFYHKYIGGKHNGRAQFSHE